MAAVLRSSSQTHAPAGSWPWYQTRYDPNLFVDGISNKDYQGLLNDTNRPLINRATQGVYPPASTVKPYIAVSALSAGVITKNTSLFDLVGGNCQFGKALP